MKPGSRWAAYVVAGFLLCPHTRADIVAVGPRAFPSGATAIDFTGLALNTEVNGLKAGGAQFTYTVREFPLNGAVEIDEGPGTTNHISPPNIVSIGNNTGTLTVVLPSSVNLFGYGFAILNEGITADATVISAFYGTRSLGSLSFSGVPDPFFAGGFAGIRSTSVFDRVELTFNSSQAPAFAVDNVTFANVVVPEPSTMLIAMLGLGITARLRFRSRL